MDKIFVKNAKYMLNVGVGKAERSVKQEIMLDLEMKYDTRKSAETDDIKDTIDYSVINKRLLQFFEGKEFRLIERLGQEVVDLIFAEFRAEEVKLAVKKPAAIKNAEYSGIEIVRKR